MAYLAESRQGTAADALGWRVRGDQMRVFGFEGFEFVEQAVVFGVGNLRRVLHVVAVAVVIQLVAECFDLYSSIPSTCGRLRAKKIQIFHGGIS